MGVSPPKATIPRQSLDKQRNFKNWKESENERVSKVSKEHKKSVMSNRQSVEGKSVSKERLSKISKRSDKVIDLDAP